MEFQKGHLPYSVLAHPVYCFGIAAAADLGCSVQTVGCFDTLAALIDRLQIAD